MIFDTWYSALMLAMESSNVIQSRMQLLAQGGHVATDEAMLMISEKLDANFEALATLFGGGTPARVIQRYREHVAVNSSRLRALSTGD